MFTYLSDLRADRKQIASEARNYRAAIRNLKSAIKARPQLLYTLGTTVNELELELADLIDSAPNPRDRRWLRNHAYDLREDAVYLRQRAFKDDDIFTDHHLRDADKKDQLADEIESYLSA